MLLSLNASPSPNPSPNTTVSRALTLTLLHNPNLVKVYDVLFALGVVLLGRRLSKCPKAQRVLEFVSES